MQRREHMIEEIFVRNTKQENYSSYKLQKCLPIALLQGKL